MEATRQRRYGLETTAALTKDNTERSSPMRQSALPRMPRILGPAPIATQSRAPDPPSSRSPVTRLHPRPTLGTRLWGFEGGAPVFTSRPNLASLPRFRSLAV